ncbi:MAG: hypothetical protein WC091_06125 [Sulfuricellaceae bacterium]
MSQAVDNLLGDIRSPSSPHGNIPAALANELETACREIPDHETAQIKTTVHQYQIGGERNGRHREPTMKPDNHLRLIFSRITIFTYHLGDGKSPSSTANAQSRMNTLFQAGSSQTQRIEIMSGATGRDGAPSWWSFKEGDNRPETADARTCMEELALSPEEIERAEKDGMAVEIMIAATDFHQNFYKPSAVDAFHENTQFRPDHSAAFHGRTAPARSELNSRPELICRSIAYTGIGDDNSKIVLTALPFIQAPSSST